MVKDIQQASRQLNKRQMTWFRDDPMYQWLDAKQPLDALVQQIVESVDQPEHVGMFLHFDGSPHVQHPPAGCMIVLTNSCCVFAHSFYAVMLGCAVAHLCMMDVCWVQVAAHCWNVLGYRSQSGLSAGIV